MRPMWAGMLRVAAAVLAAGLLAGPASAQTSGKTIKFIPEADLRSLDPIWTTAYITRNHGYMVYDTLFALDEHFKPQPQMVDTLDGQRRQAHLHLHAARQASSSTTARRCARPIASPRCSAG